MLIYMSTYVKLELFFNLFIFFDKNITANDINKENHMEE